MVMLAVMVAMMMSQHATPLTTSKAAARAYLQSCLKETACCPDTELVAPGRTILLRLLCMPPHSHATAANCSHVLRQLIPAFTCKFCTPLRARPLLLLLLCLWLTVFVIYSSSRSAEALPSSITRAAAPGTTRAFSLHPEPSHPPTCRSLVSTLSRSNHWLQASHPHPSLAAAMSSCTPSAAAAALQRIGLRPLSMRITLSDPPSPASAMPPAPTPSSTELSSDATLFYTVLGPSSARSAACSSLKRAADERSASSFFFLLRQPNPTHPCHRCFSTAFAFTFIASLPISRHLRHAAPTTRPLSSPARPPPCCLPTPASAALKSPSDTRSISCTLLHRTPTPTPSCSPPCSRAG